MVIYSHQQAIARIEASIQQAKENFEVDSHLPIYHATPGLNWINDPNGMIFFRGEYHLFYQYNPYGVNWGNMHWGHMKSTDLVHWVHLPIALAPSEAYDCDGIFSGSAIEHEGRLYVFYTANVCTSAGGSPNDLL